MSQETLPPAVATPEAPQRTRNGLAVAGFILAIFVAPLGLILSLIGLIQAGKRGQKGRVLAVLGIMISLAIIGGTTAAVVSVGKEVVKAADPGCTTGKAAILDNAEKVSNQATMKQGMEATIAGLNDAAAKTKKADVRDAMKALADDYSQLLKAINTNTVPDSGLQAKINTDAAKIDSLCTVGS